MPKLALLLEYDGTCYSGWQRQKNAPSVQEEIERAFEHLTQVQCDVIGSGRTDAGVHGYGQVAHAAIPVSCTIPEEKFARALNSVLPTDIRIRSVRCVSDEFHARFQAVRREYCYTLSHHYSVFRRRYSWQVRVPFNAALLARAAEVFLGKHDFTTFSKLNHDTEHYHCAVEHSEWREIEHGVWQYRIAANRFVYGMVRSIVGAMIDVASHKRTADDLRAALARCNRAFASPLAPPVGLILWRVRYEEENDPFASLYESCSHDDMLIVG
jgi:tRNA pseudouridine38-40 synthase